MLEPKHFSQIAMAIDFSQLKGQVFAKNLSLFIIVSKRMQVCLKCCIFGMVVGIQLTKPMVLMLNL
jgi:hypothetical protein